MQSPRKSTIAAEASEKNHSGGTSVKSYSQQKSRLVKAPKDAQLCRHAANPWHAAHRKESQSKGE